MNSFPLCAIIVIFTIIAILNGSDARDRNILEVGLDYVELSVENAPKDLFTEPENKLSSIKYELYTRKNPKDACYIEPTPEKFDNCPFNPNCKTKFLILGFFEELRPGNLFDELRDALLAYKNYNIIYVDWTLYNKLPITRAVDNTPKVGRKAAEMIHFMMNHTGISAHQLHCIGHSGGAHVCGHAARHVPNFSRVTGLDPGFITIFKLFKKDILLKYTDANFVDVVHTSFIFSGLGLGTLQPLGHMDFYVNGGIVQKPCEFGKKYKVFAGDVLPVLTIADKILCDHFIAIEYFTNSVRTDCKFLGTRCDNFLRAVLNPVIKLCPTNSSITAEMGFHSRKISGLPPKSAFYVDALASAPYCKEHK